MTRIAAPVDKDRSSYEKSRLIPTFTFDNLVVGKANDLARAAARRVALSPGEATYNPLFIYGGAGLGKTHLVHAIGNQILEHCPEKVVRYVHAEDYYSDVVRAYHLVTHRVAAAARCDRVIVLEQGKIAEQGTHDELLRLGGLYPSLAEEQRRERELAELRVAS